MLMTQEEIPNSLFFATSFSSKVNYGTGLVLPEFRVYVSDLLNALREIGGFSVFCAAEYEGWKIGDEPAHVGVAKDLEEIKKNDIFLALESERPSWGVSYELGEARTLGKHAILASPKGQKLGYFAQGVVDLGLIPHISFSGAQDLATQVKAII